MPPQLALALNAAFVGILFWWDVRQRPNVTKALWIPLCWVLLSGSRFVSQWIGGGLSASGGALEDGSPLDRLVFTGLIVSGMAVLAARRVNLLQVANRNRWLAAYFVYCFVAVLWSDYQYVAFKRWVKTFGEPILVLVVLSEPEPWVAVKTLFRRCAYLLIPLSITFIKYFPHLGRSFSFWTGAPENTGVTFGKNHLGYLCMVVGLFFFWDLAEMVRLGKTREQRQILVLNLAFLAMTWWLLLSANSSTPLVGSIAGMGVMVWAVLPFVNRKQVGGHLIVAALLFFVLDQGFGLTEAIIRMLGRDPTLTGRTDLWADLFAMKTNPFVGAGFESFWLGERLAHLWRLHTWRPNQAHNGYLEVYLNLGLVGLTLVIGALLVTFHRACKTLLVDVAAGRFYLGFVVAIIVYNWTESSFRTLHLVNFCFYLVALEFVLASSRASSGPGTARSHVAAGALSRGKDTATSTWKRTRPARIGLRSRVQRAPRMADHDER